ncbi:MAG TPA: SGNH/GDSL hydrolase family protein [Gaiellaceae bacterium]|nr:SGNH/GDSL hydrolase family protein [Gaiellaceae bacterium]
MVCLAAVLLLAACGSAARHSSKPSRTIFVAALGDSITAGSPGYDPSHGDAKLLGFAENPKSQWEYWAALENPRLVFRNCGVFGERTDQIAERLVACQTGADVLVVQGGINDIAQSRPVAEAARNLQAMVEQGKKLGLRVEIAQLIPWNNGWPDADPKIRALNRLIDAIGRDDHVRVLPFYAVLDDPQRPGRMKEAWTADGDHPSIAGYRRLGELAFRLP